MGLGLGLGLGSGSGLGLGLGFGLGFGYIVQRGLRGGELLLLAMELELARSELRREARRLRRALHCRLLCLPPARRALGRLVRVGVG